MTSHARVSSRGIPQYHSSPTPSYLRTLTALSRILAALLVTPPSSAPAGTTDSKSRGAHFFVTPVEEGRAAEQAAEQAESKRRSKLRGHNGGWITRSSGAWPGRAPHGRIPHAALLAGPGLRSSLTTSLTSSLRS